MYPTRFPLCGIVPGDASTNNSTQLLLVSLHVQLFGYMLRFELRRLVGSISCEMCDDTCWIPPPLELFCLGVVTWATFRSVVPVSSLVSQLLV